MNDEQPILLGFWEGKRWKQARAVFDGGGLSPTLTAQMGGKHQNNFVHIMETKECKQVGQIVANGLTEMTGRIYGTEGISPATRTFSGGNTEIKIKEDDMKLRIRKLTEGECMRLMGFEREDTEACRKAGLSRANIWHQSGDSIVSTVLVGIFGSLLGIDYKKDIEEYVDKLHNEVI